MDSQETDYHVESPTGALFTKFWQGGYRPSFVPLTHVVVASKTPLGIVLVDSEEGDSWRLPGGTLSEDETVVDCAKRRLAGETGLVAQNLVAFGYFRLVMDGKVEYGALVFCRSAEPNQMVSARVERQVRTWDCESPLSSFDPIAGTLAAIAAQSKAWLMG